MDKKRTTVSETRLAYRLRMLSKEERDQLMEQLHMGKTAWYARLTNPRTFTLDEASTVTRFLEALDNEEYDVYRLLEPVEIAA